MTWHPREEDLAPWMRRALEEAYEQRERPRCSRDDFRDGFLSALRVLRSRSSFLPDRFEPSSEDA
jgi:hypothetical protein